MKFGDEDILAYTPETDTWSMLVDGSDLGLRRLDLTDFYFMADGTILMNFNRAFDLPGLGRVDDSDIVRFHPTKLGNETEGSFEWYFDGSDVGLKKGGEDIDALTLDPLGNLVVSTKGSFHADDQQGRDEDLFVFKPGDGDPAAADLATEGSWELYFDGSQVGLNEGHEDIDGAWIDQGSGNLYLTTKGDFTAEGSNSGLEGDGDDIFICVPLALGEVTDCTFFPFFDGDTARFTRRIDGLAVADAETFAAVWVNTVEDEAEESDDAQSTLLEEDEVEAAATDAEVDLYDQEAEEEETMFQGVLFLPLIRN